MFSGTLIPAAKTTPSRIIKGAFDFSDSIPLNETVNLSPGAFCGFASTPGR